eukprot:7505191-Heterocapsa_arctica.AAC.1
MHGGAYLSVVRRCERETRLAARLDWVGCLSQAGTRPYAHTLSSARATHAPKRTASFPTKNFHH